MEHSTSLIATIAVGFGLALILGFAAEKLKIPALVGYLFAGILIVALSAVLSTAWRPLLGVAAIAAVAVAIAEVFLIRGGS